MDFLIDDETDWVLENGELLVIRDDSPENIAKQVKQNDQQIMSFHFADWYRDKTLGIPYHEIIFQKNASQTEVRRILREAILSTPGSYSLENLSIAIDYEKRKLELSYSKKVEGLESPITFRGSL